MTKKEDKLLDTITHFHPESGGYGGWACEVKKEEVVFFTKNFKNLRLFKDGKRTLVTTRGGQAGKFSTEHTILMLKYERDSALECENKLYNGLRKLLDD